MGLPQNSASKRRPWLLSLLKLRMRLLFLIGYFGNLTWPPPCALHPGTLALHGCPLSSWGPVSWILVLQSSFVLPCLAPLLLAWGGEEDFLEISTH